MSISIIFNISRLASDLGQLWLGEYSSREGDLRTLARLHYGSHSFVSGLPYAVVQGDQVSFTQEREEEFKDSVIRFNIELNEYHLEYLNSLLYEEDSLSPLGVLLEEPPLNEKGESLLRGYQLHLVVPDDVLSDVSQSKEGVTTYRVEDVQKIRLVKRGEADFISRKTEVNLSDALSVMFKKTAKDSGPIQGRDHVKSKLLDMMASRPSAKKRSLGIVSPLPAPTGQEPRVVSVERRSPLEILNQVNSSDL